MGKRRSPDNEPIENKFGYAVMVEKDAIRQRLLADGVDPHMIEFRVSEEYQRAHANDLTFAERSKAMSERWKAQSKARFENGLEERGLGLNIDELRFLAEHFEGANDPDACSILAKVRAVLDQA